MSINKIKTLWDSMESKLDLFYKNQLLELAQIIFNFNPSDAPLLPANPTIEGDKLRREMLKKVNQIADMPLIVHIGWSLPPSLELEEGKKTLGKKLTLILYGLFDVYMCLIPTALIGSEKKEDSNQENELNPPYYYETIVLAFISTQLTTKQLYDYENDINQMMIPGDNLAETKKLIRGTFQNESFKQQYNLYLGYFPYSKNFASLYLKKFEGKIAERRLNAEVLQFREEMLKSITFPIIESSYTNQFHKKYSLIKKNLLSIINTLTPEQKYVYGEYGDFFLENDHPIPEPSIVIDYTLRIVIVDGDSYYQLILMINNSKYITTARLIKEELESETTIFVKKSKEYENIYEITSEKSPEAIRFLPLSNEKYYRTGNIITLDITNNYYFQTRYWINELLESGLNLFSLDHHYFSNWRNNDGLKKDFFKEFYPEFQLSEIEHAIKKQKIWKK